MYVCTLGETSFLFTCGEASRSIGAQFLSLLLLEKFQIGGHRARITGQFNVIDHSELKYEVSSPPGGATCEIGQLFWPFETAEGQKRLSLGKFIENMENQELSAIG